MELRDKGKFSNFQLFFDTFKSKAEGLGFSVQISELCIQINVYEFGIVFIYTVC